jgi:hypothetical protein
MDDLNKAFTERPNQYDLVSSRGVGGGINRERWPSYIRDIKRYTLEIMFKGIR